MVGQNVLGVLWGRRRMICGRTLYHARWALQHAVWEHQGMVFGRTIDHHFGEANQWSMPKQAPCVLTVTCASVHNDAHKLGTCGQVMHVPGREG